MAGPRQQAIDLTVAAPYPRGMTDQNWFGVVADEHHAIGWRFHGASAAAQATGNDANAVCAALDVGTNDRVLLVSDVAEATPTPARVVPEAGVFSPLSQSQPLGLLPASARLQAVGFLNAHRDWDGVICLPHADCTHWCQISADEIVSFQGFLTGQMAAVLGETAPVDEQALSETLSRPERLAAHLRSAQVSGMPGQCTGHLMGAELSAARAFWLGQQVALIGDSPLTDGYFDALTAQGVPVIRANHIECLQQGLFVLHMLRTEG